MAKGWLAGALLGKDDAEVLFPEKVRDPISGVPTVRTGEKSTTSVKPYIKKQPPLYSPSNRRYSNKALANSSGKKQINNPPKEKQPVNPKLASGGKINPYPGNSDKHVVRRIISLLFVVAAIVGLFYFNRTIPGNLPQSITSSGIFSIATDHYVNNYDFRIGMTFIMVFTLAITVNMLFNSRVILEDTLYMLVIFTVGFMIIGTTVNNFVGKADYDQREKAIESWIQKETGLNVNLDGKRINDDFFVTSEGKTVTVKNISKSNDSHTKKYSLEVTQQIYR